jgi:FSR family fosmidomycin resistance protein-like MFS transporter
VHDPTVPHQVRKPGLLGGTALAVFLALVHTVNDAITAILGALLPTLQERFELGATALALIVAVYWIASSVTQPLLGVLAEDLGLRAVAAAGVLLASLFLSLVGVAPTLWIVFALLVVGGVGSAALHPVGTTIAGAASTRNRAFGVGLFTAGGMVGFALGPVLILYLVSTYGTDATPWLMVPGAVLALAVLLLLPDWQPHGRRPFRELFDVSLVRGPVGVLALAGSFASIAFVTFTTSIPVWLVRDHGYATDASLIGWTLAVFSLAAGIGALAGGLLATRIGRARDDRRSAAPHGGSAVRDRRVAAGQRRVLRLDRARGAARLHAQLGEGRDCTGARAALAGRRVGHGARDGIRCGRRALHRARSAPGGDRARGVHACGVRHGHPGRDARLGRADPASRRRRLSRCLWTGEPAVAGGRADEDLPRVEAVEGANVPSHDTGVREHGVDVERRVVVREERAAQVAGGAGGAEQVGGAEDRVARIVDVAAEPVRTPGRRQELHRPLCACGARGAHLAERRLDEVDGGEHVPGHAEASLRLAVVPEQPAGGLRRAGAERGERQRRRRREAYQRTPRGDDVARLCALRGGQAREDGVAVPARREPEREVEPLLVKRPEPELAGLP